MAYDGTPFIGWQKQPNNPASIQGVIESCLQRIYQDDISIVGSGRTDRGVHALNQWAHFDLKDSAPVEQLKYKLQRMTPEEILIKKLELVPADFHAQISAQQKTYIYRLQLGHPPSPFGRHFCWSYPKKLDFDLLQQASQMLVGEWDFSSFQSRGTPVNSPIRRLDICQWQRVRPHLWILKISGNGFLKQMVRNIVGTLVALNESGSPAEEILQILESKDRQRAAAPAPPQGLFLSQVKYPRQLDNKCRKL
jgi:tRNA pseudouridine38-40 synthase